MSNAISTFAAPHSVANFAWIAATIAGSSMSENK